VQFLREQNAVLLLQPVAEAKQQARCAPNKKWQSLETVVRDNQGDETSHGVAGLNFGKVNLSAEGGVAFSTPAKTALRPIPISGWMRRAVCRTRAHPSGRTFIFSSDIELGNARENNDTGIYLGELYLDFEDSPSCGGQEGQLNIRAGRMQMSLWRGIHEPLCDGESADPRVRCRTCGA